MKRSSIMMAVVAVLAMVAFAMMAIAETYTYTYTTNGSTSTTVVPGTSSTTDGQTYTTVIPGGTTVVPGTTYHGGETVVIPWTTPDPVCPVCPTCPDKICPDKICPTCPKTECPQPKPCLACKGQNGYVVNGKAQLKAEDDNYTLTVLFLGIEGVKIIVIGEPVNVAVGKSAVSVNAPQGAKTWIATCDSIQLPKEEIPQEEKCFETYSAYVGYDVRASYHPYTVVKAANGAVLFDSSTPLFPSPSSIVSLGITKGGAVPFSAQTSLANGQVPGYIKEYSLPASGLVDDIVAVDGRPGVPVSSVRLGDLKGIDTSFDEMLSNLQAAVNLAVTNGYTMLSIIHVEDSADPSKADWRTNLDWCNNCIDLPDLLFLKVGKEVSCPAGM